MNSSSPFPYELVYRLPDGVLSENYLAQALDFPSVAIVKVLKPDLMAEPIAVERFEQEARFGPMLQHPRLLRYVDAGRFPDGRPFLATERLEGEDLAMHLYHHGPLSPQAVARLALPLCDAVDFLHRVGVVHGGIKPQSIYLDGGLQAYQPKLGDFEMALFPNSASLPLRHELAVYAAYPYPEGGEGRQPTRRADIYALGAVMAHALTGQPPTPSAEPLLLPSAAAHLTPVIDRCLQLHPQDRFDSAAELAAAIRGVTHIAKPRLEPLASAPPAQAPSPETGNAHDTPYFLPGTAPSLRNLGVS
ncbi:MAG TPA: serine/threonine-protein kinase, partial [Myxococcaceae bacterium]|nr:serine/threonine-protein kinase [Myxococcaceae bacterium]